MSGQYTLPRAERLTRASDYRFVFEHGEKLVGRYFICYLVRREEQGCKLGIAVSRRIGKAVVRNRIKRCIREFYRTHRPAFLTGAYLVVVARPACAGLSCAECAAAIGQLLRQGGVLNG